MIAPFMTLRLHRAVACCTLLLTVAALPAQAFDFNDVAAQAKALSEKPYDKPETRLPKALIDLGYDQYRQIQFKPDHALWHNSKLPFELQFYLVCSDCCRTDSKE